MTGKLFGVQITVSFWFLTVLLLSILLGQQVFLIYFFLPIVVHELGHLMVILGQGGLKGISFHAFGVKMIPVRSRLAFWEEVLLHCGGILANSLFAAVLYSFFFQSMRIRLMIAVNIAVVIFNLLPVGDLDGGRLIRLLSYRWLSPEAAYAVSRFAALLVLTPLITAGLLLAFGKARNFTLLVTCIYLAATVLVRDHN